MGLGQNTQMRQVTNLRHPQGERERRERKKRTVVLKCRSSMFEGGNFGPFRTCFALFPRDLERWRIHGASLERGLPPVNKMIFVKDSVCSRRPNRLRLRCFSGRLPRRCDGDSIALRVWSLDYAEQRIRYRSWIGRLFSEERAICVPFSARVHGRTPVPDGIETQFETTHFYANCCLYQYSSGGLGVRVAR